MKHYFLKCQGSLFVISDDDRDLIANGFTANWQDFLHAVSNRTRHCLHLQYL